MTSKINETRLACYVCMLAPMALAAQQTNVIEVVVGNGPFAGPYKPSGGGVDIICLYVKQKPQPQFAATWRDLTPTPKTVLAEAGVSISNPDAAALVATGVVAHIAACDHRGVQARAPQRREKGGRRS